MGKKIITHEESDEDLILRSLMKGKKPDLEQPVPSEKENAEDKLEITPPPTKEQGKKKKQREQIQDYVELFIKESTEISRVGKTINIRTEFHERIQMIVQMIGDNKVTIFSYIDNILKMHMDQYEEIIDELLEENFKRKLPSKKR